MNLILDIETNLKHDQCYLAVTKNLSNGVIECHTESSSLKPLIEAAEVIIGHNVINFDLPVLERLWKIPTKSKKCFDTLIASRLANPDRNGGHSLKNWGTILNFPKGDFLDFDSGLSQTMIDYCVQDVNLTHRVYSVLKKELFTFSEQSIELEHAVARIIGEQERYGFLLDVPYASVLLAEIKGKMDAFNVWAEENVPGTVKQLKTKVKTIPFNPGSRQQIATYLKSLGWKPKEKTETGLPVVNEKTLAAFKHPVAERFQEYLMLQKRAAQIESWLEAADGEGRVHGGVITNGAVTGRMTHRSPNMAQVPAKKAPYGKECRSCWTVPEGKVIVGVDASGLELRMLAHYMGDPEYVKAVCEGAEEEGTDVHSVNQRAVGLATRAEAKTFIYAFLYGAGAGKIGSIIHGGAAEGERLINKFLSATPNLQKLRKRVLEEAAEGTIKGLDGRVLSVRAQHSALNTLLQGAGAIVMKQALVFANDAVVENGYDSHFVANIHDEWQIECLPEDAEHIGQIGVMAIEAAGRHFNLTCPLTGVFHVGKTWADTH